MYTVIRRYPGNDLAPIVKANEESLREAMSGIPGFRGYYMVQAGGELVTITVCNDQAGTQESNRRAATWVKAHMPASANLSAPQVTEGETIVDISR
jgi:hypothetical protein